MRGGGELVRHGSDDAVQVPSQAGSRQFDLRDRVSDDDEKPCLADQRWYAQAAGNQSVTVVPRPVTLVSSSLPPDRPAKPRAIDRPSPVP